MAFVIETRFLPLRICSYGSLRNDAYEKGGRKNGIQKARMTTTPFSFLQRRKAYDSSTVSLRAAPFTYSHWLKYSFSFFLTRRHRYTDLVSISPPALHCPKRWISFQPSSSSSFSTTAPSRPGTLVTTTAFTTTSGTSAPLSNFSSPFFSSWTPRKVASIQALGEDIFSRGNVHLKNVKHLHFLPEGLHSFPEVCFIGKPNVGKSSIISCLLHNAVLGRGGKYAGTTRLLKFFNVGDAIALVDTPGYGGWKLKKGTSSRQRKLLPAIRAQAFAILFRYLALRWRGKGLKRVYWVMEANAGSSSMCFQPRDEEILAFLQKERIPFTVILSKIDRHWRCFQEYRTSANRSTKNQFMVDKDGVPQLYSSCSTSSLVSSPSRNEKRIEGIGDASNQSPLSFFRAGVQRNMKEIFHFLGSEQIPILCVSANRFQPQRSLYMDSLRCDIVYQCVADLPDDSWSYNDLHEMSYAPPTADDLQDVQLQYPVESFVVPNDNNVSLAQMVDRHEKEKAKLLGRRDLTRQILPYTLPQSFGKPSVSSIGMVDKREGPERNHRVRKKAMETSVVREEKPPVFSSLAKSSPSFQNILDRSSAKEENRVGLLSHLLVRRKLLNSVSGELTSSIPEVVPPPNSTSFLPCNASNSSVPGENKELFLATIDKAASVLEEKTKYHSGWNCVPSPSGLMPSSNSFAAVNGVRIPSTLVPTCLEQTLKVDSDEIVSFAMKSGAGGFESLMVEEYLGDSDPESCTSFLEHSSIAKIQAGLEVHPDGTQKYSVFGDFSFPPFVGRHPSVRKKREKELLQKYVDRHRKNRSVALSAEGYMCPWLSASGKIGNIRSSVVGFVGGGRSGAVMKGLKESGFGGKSYSAGTLKHRGRATKKTGFWAT